MTKSTLRALRHRNFAMVELAGWSAAAGFWFYRIGLQVLTWELTHSGAWLGTIALAEAIPLFLLLPVGGTLADRFDRIALARIIQFAIMAVTGLLAVVTIIGWINPYLLVVLAMLHGVTGALWMPVRLAMVPNLVPPGDLSAAVALHATLFNLARFVGPALAAPILAFWGVGPAFAIGAACYLPYFVVLFMVELVYTDKRAEPGRKIFEHVKEGIAYAFGHPALKYLFVIILVSSVFGRAYMDLLAGISEIVFFRDPKEAVAILVSAIGLGAIFGSLLLGNITRTEALLRAYFICLAASLFFLALFAATHNFWFAVGCAVFLSVATVGMDITSQVMVQVTVRGELRGRAMALWGLFSRSGPAVGAVLLGWLSGFFGFQWPILAAAVITAVVGFHIFSKRKEIGAGFDSESD
ncbi:MAG: MFS transporter [Rhodospirillales bacterium]|nr:MFS transporter [Rhodospirillales bacterium]MDP6644501.1 MFS transporter [Rhodospirillales bacterium]